MHQKSLWQLSLVCALMSGIAPLAAAQVTFDPDPVGAKPTTGWQSSQSADVTFSVFDATLGHACASTDYFCDLEVYDWSSSGGGSSHALSTVWGNTRYSLQMVFGSAVNQLSFNFGGDDEVTYQATGGYRGILTLFNDAVQLTQIAIDVNGNRDIDQLMSYTGSSFNRAIFSYDANGSTAETIDNLTYTLAPPGGEGGGGDPVVTPEPGSLVLLATGLVGVVGIGRRRRSM
jgi:hypothetical protein